MSGVPEEAIRPSTREAILRAAIRALARDGAATTSEIALAAGVGRATLHRHFRTREDLIDAVQARCLEETEAAVRQRSRWGATPRERLEDMLDAVVPLGDRYAFLARSDTTDSALRAAYVAQLAWLEALVEDLKNAGDVDHALPTSWVVAQIDRLVWTTWGELAAGRLAPRDATALALRTLIHGMAPRSAAQEE